MDIINSIGQGIHNLGNFFAQPKPTNQLPSGMVSPIPQDQIVKSQPKSAYEQALGNVAQGAQNVGQGIQNMGNFVSHVFHPAPPTPQQNFAPMQQGGIAPTRQPVQNGISGTPTPSPYPGQVAWGQMMGQKMHGQPQQYEQMYRQAVSSPGFTGHYYGVTPTPTQAPSAMAQAKQQFAQPQADDTPLPTGVDRALKYVSSFVPGGQDPRQYFPALADPGFMQQVMQADKAKPGLGNVLLMQAFHESTLGRAANNNNIFGALPGGEGSGRSAGFQSPADAVTYQLGPNMLGGGGNPNMNIMGEHGPLTQKRLVQLYKSYNPEGAYINQILGALR